MPRLPSEFPTATAPIGLLYGAEAIAGWLFPDAPTETAIRRVYHLTSEVPEAERLPVFRLAGTLCARPERLLAHIIEREGRPLPKRGKAA